MDKRSGFEIFTPEFRNGFAPFVGVDLHKATVEAGGFVKWLIDRFRDQSTHLDIADATEFSLRRGKHRKNNPNRLAAPFIDIIESSLYTLLYLLRSTSKIALAAFGNP